MTTIDIHTHVGRSLYGHHLTEEELLRRMDALRIDRSILIPFKPKGYDLSPENDRVLRAVQRYPDRFRAFLRVDPWQGAAALAEIDRFEAAIEGGAVCGIFLHPWEENFPVEGAVARPIFAKAAQYALPVMISGGHVRVSTAWQIGAVARRFPSVTIIATSGGQINISGAALYEAEVMLREHRNVLMETSGIYREDFIEDMAREFGAGRILFGSNAPIFDLELELLRVKKAHLPLESIERIAGGNAEALLAPRGG